MKMKINMITKSLWIVFPFFILVMGTASTKAQTEPWTLKSAVLQALENNIQIRQANLSTLDAQAAKSEAIGGFLPNVNVAANHSWNIGLNQNITTGLLEDVTTQFTNASVSVGVDLYRGGQNVLQLLRANLALLASQYQIEDMKEDVALFVANGYLQAVFSREAVGIEQAQLELTKSELQRTQEQVQAGVLPEGDLFEMQAVLASQEQQLVVAQNQYTMAKLSLAQLLLIQDYENFEIADEDFAIEGQEILVQRPTDLVAKALDYRNDIKLAMTNIDIAKTDLRLAKSVSKPSLSGFYSYSSRISYADRLEIGRAHVRTPVTA